MLAALPAQDVTGEAVASESVVDSTADANDDYQPIVVFASEDASGSQINSSQEGQPSTVWLFVRMILVLVFVIACIYFVVFFIKKSSKTGLATYDPYLKVVSSISLAPGKTIYVVTLNNVGYIIGVTDNAVNLIGTFEDKDLIDAMNLNADKNNASSNQKNFSSILDFFLLQKKSKDGKQEKKSVFTNSSVQFFQKQQDRLNETPENPTEDLGDNQ